MSAPNYPLDLTAAAYALIFQVDRWNQLVSDINDRANIFARRFTCLVMVV